MVSHKAYLQKLNENRPPRTSLQKMFNEAAKSIIKNVDSLVKLDEPLPVSQLSRYLTVVCLAGIHAGTGSEQRDWMRILNTLMRTEILSRSQDKDDKDFTEAQVAQVEKIIEAANNYQRFTDAQYETFESDNGDARPAEGEKGA